MNAAELIAKLELASHSEGGYFRRTYTSSVLAENRQRACASAIFYLLSTESPVGHLHRNRSDILHFWQGGRPLRYTLIDTAGQLSEVVMGPELDRGQQLQLLVPGGVWKASELMHSPCGDDYGLISEAVCPGFDFADHHMADWPALLAEHPGLKPHYPHLKRLIANHD